MFQQKKRKSPLDKCRAVSLFLVVAVLAAGSSAQAADDAATNGGMRHPAFTNKHTFTAGVAVQETEMSLAATLDGFAPVAIDLEDLGVDDQDTSYYFEYRYRVRPRWVLTAGAYRFLGDGGQILERDFNFDGVDYTAGVDIEAELEVDAYFVKLLYSVYQSENVEVLMGGGVHALDLRAEISEQVSVNDANTQFRQSGASLLAPVPNLHGSIAWAVSERFGVSLVGGWLSANVDDYDGSFAYAHLRGLYQLTNKLGVSLGYQVTDFDITQSRAVSELSFDGTLVGPTLTLQYGF